jgi:acyl-CoA synthetase (NDP forming)
MPERAEKMTEVVLDEVAAKKLLQEAGIPVVETRLARTKAEAVKTAKEMGFPVALKIISPDVIHKSDAGGVKLGLGNAGQAGRAYSEMTATIKQKIPGARIQGVSVQKMADPGVELIIGMNKDPQFGPVLMFGLGGILVEVLKDISFRLVPVSKRDASEMVREIKGYRLLEGYRGQEPVDIDCLEDIIVKVSDFIEKNPQIKELDINPLFASGKVLEAADARIVMESAR